MDIIILLSYRTLLLMVWVGVRVGLSGFKQQLNSYKHLNYSWCVVGLVVSVIDCTCMLEVPGSSVLSVLCTFCVSNC